MTLWNASPPQGVSSDQLTILSRSPMILIASPQGPAVDTPLTGAEMAYEDLDIMAYEDGTLMEYES